MEWYKIVCTCNNDHAPLCSSDTHVGFCQYDEGEEGRDEIVQRNDGIQDKVSELTELLLVMTLIMA